MLNIQRVWLNKMLDVSNPIINKLWSIQPKIHNYKICEGGEQEYCPLRTDFVNKSSKFREAIFSWFNCLVLLAGARLFLEKDMSLRCHVYHFSQSKWEQSLTLNGNLTLNICTRKRSEKQAQIQTFPLEAVALCQFYFR